MKTVLAEFQRQGENTAGFIVLEDENGAWYLRLLMPYQDFFKDIGI